MECTRQVRSTFDVYSMTLFVELNQISNGYETTAKSKVQISVPRFLLNWTDEDPDQNVNHSKAKIFMVILVPKT